ncbi:MAG: T9SS type A sorting domain-containing protein [Rhodothermales bacterium]|nr:T9SS type A sorting domain-containing protein [Rhodothermales bacterium]
MIAFDTKTRGVLLGMILLLSAPVAFAQSGLTVSRNSDFSTHDLTFEPGEKMFVLVDAPELDPMDIDANELRLRHENSGEEIRFRLENQFNARYTADVQLPDAEWARGRWTLHVRLRDKVGHEFEARLSIGIGAGVQLSEFELEGLVTDLGDGFIGVMHRKIRVTERTEIEDDTDRPIRLSDIEVGDRVHVRGIIGDDGTPVAKRIQLKSHDGQNEVEFSGMIQEVFDRGIVMFGRKIEVNEQTEIFGANEQPILFSELQPGMMARVKVRVDMDHIVALRIRVRAGNDFTFEVKGTITSIGDRGFELENHFIAVDDQTEYFGKNGEQLTFGDLEVGMFVQVHGVLGADRVPTARRVKVEDEPGPREFEVKGFIREIGDNAILITWDPRPGTMGPSFAMKILVTDDTKILGKDDEPITFADLEVGQFVEVHGFVNDEGVPVARLIEVEEPERQEITVAGEIQRLGDRVLVVKSIPFRVTNDTQIVDEMGAPLRFSDLSVGMFARVKGYIFPATHEAVALKIEVRTRRYVHLTGTINEIGSDAISVSGIRVFVTADTKIMDVDGNALEFADLEVGQVVRVIGWKTDGGVMARSIRVRLRVEDEVLVAAVLEAVEGESITVLGVSFQLLSTTVILDESGNEIGVDGLEIGKPVAIRGDLLEDGTLVAYKVKKLDRDVRGIHVVGPVESSGASTIEVIGIHFFVDGSTQIVDVLGRPITLTDIALGATVDVHAVGQPDGTRLARKIRVLEVLVVMGDVDVLASDRVQILGRDFMMDSDPLVMLDNGRAGSLAETGSFSLVEIRAATNEAGELVVSKITMHQDSQSTTVETDPDGDALPASFNLGQNYPNPFNPSTTIELEVTSAGSVDLTIYNVLGQRVATLASGVLASGTYSFVWNGTDASGAAVASGLYLYQARVAGTVQTRTMALIK